MEPMICEECGEETRVKIFTRKGQICMPCWRERNKVIIHEDKEAEKAKDNGYKTATIPEEKNESNATSS